MANHSSAESHPSHLHHHFVNSDQQFDAAKVGMWIFLVTEVLFFGGLFAAYIVYRTWYPELFTLASAELDTLLGGLNTLVLIGSSLTVAMAIKAAQENKQKQILINLGITIALACTFMVVKYFEYTHKFELGIYAGEAYSYTGVDHPQANIFFSIYYLMTGLHGIHVVIGIGIMIWMMIKAYKGTFSSEYYTPVEITGLYWHLVDIIWIFLFPLFYLIE